jgi:histidinol-phosphate aminotransferase
MRVSRRSLLQSLGATAVTGSTAKSLLGASVPEVSEPSRCANPAQCSILLDHNENAYGPSEKVLQVLRDAPNTSNRYPRTEYDLLLSKIAALHGVKSEQIVLGCGSSEILRLITTKFLAPGKGLVQAAPTCPLLGRFARSMGAEVVDVPVTRTYEHDLEAMLARAGDSAGLVHICNPNNPTGTLIRRKDIETFVRKLPAKMMVLVDEAYYDFVGPSGADASFLEQPFDDPRVMVTRTFSKMYGLAGMRVGYVVATPEIARRISADRVHPGISMVSAKAAAAALDDSEFVRVGAKRNADDRQEFSNQVNARFLHALDSHTNFFMLDPMRPIDQVLEHFKNHNIFIGPQIAEMPQYVRVSLGTPTEMAEFWRVLDLMPGSGKMVM